VVPPQKYPPTPLGVEALQCVGAKASEGYPPVAKSAEATGFNTRRVEARVTHSSTGKARGLLRRRINIKEARIPPCYASPEVTHSDCSESMRKPHSETPEDRPPGTAGIKPGEGKRSPETAEIIICLLLLRYALCSLRLFDGEAGSLLRKKRNSPTGLRRSIYEERTAVAAPVKLHFLLRPLFLLGSSHQFMPSRGRVPEGADL
jgi:hypothetical protein